MKIHSLKISGFRRIKNATIEFGDATFLIGPNNVGKSTVLKAMEWLLSGKKTIPSTEYYSVVDEETKETKPATDEIIFEAEFRNLPIESQEWRGFKGRIFTYSEANDEDTGLSVVYRKTFKLGKDVIVEFKSKGRDINPKYKDCKIASDLISAGMPAECVSENFPELTAKLSLKGSVEKLALIDDYWEVNENEEWFQNPGGIPGNVLKMLPRFLLIPADTASGEIEGGSTGVLGKTLNELFEDVRSTSPNYAQAQEFLDKLAEELNPNDSSSEFGKMISELNNVLASVFPDSLIHASASLSDPKTAIKPAFNIEMSSNVKTSVANQGSGMIRAAAFGMLRFRQKWLSKREDEHPRSLIVCFEEPEIYLHPSAANQMRDTIYELSTKNSQIIATTHSPFIIDLSRKPKQVLNRLRINDGDIESLAFNVSSAYKNLEGDDKDYVKMLLRIDDHLARIFFTKKVIVVEGDTEEIAIKETLKLLPDEIRIQITSDFEIIKARGKASIIGLVKYLAALGISPIVVHDRDIGTPRAAIFNDPIASAVGTNGTVIQMKENIEDEIGYTAPNSEKPYTAFKETQKWGNWDGVPSNWKLRIKQIFGDDYITV